MTQILDRAWLLGHIDYIWNNRHRLQNRPCAEFVLTGFVINSFGCPYYAYKIDTITLGSLIQLWNNGFVYKDFPLIHYRISHGDTSTNIAYITKGKVFCHKFSYKDQNRYIPTEEVKQILKSLRQYSRY